MHPILLKAVKTARKHINSHVNPSQKDAKALRKRLNKLDKAALIEEIVQLKVPTAPKVKISTLVYAILQDPDCAWLTWDTIAALITTSVPGSKTTSTSLQWYPAEGTKKGLDIIPRKPTKDIAKLLTSTIQEGDAS